MENLSVLLERLVNWATNSGSQITIIVIAALVLHYIAHIVIAKGIRRAVRGDKYLRKEAEEKRENTLIKVFHKAFDILLWAAVILMIFSELGLNIGPMLAAAGVAGLAFGFGGQYLIKDLITGFFIIMENQYRVGDVVCIGDKCGLVEDINLRLTVLRDLDGKVHHIPNGEVNIASNLTKGFSRLLIDVGVSYDSNLEQVIEVVNKTGQDMANDPKWKEDITDAPKFLRVEDFGDSAIIIRILGDTLPLRQWDVMGEFRKRLKIAFDKADIVIPYPQRVLHGSIKSE